MSNLRSDLLSYYYYYYYYHQFTCQKSFCSIHPFHLLQCFRLSFPKYPVSVFYVIFSSFLQLNVYDVYLHLNASQFGLLSFNFQRNIKFLIEFIHYTRYFNYEYVI